MNKFCAKFLNWVIIWFNYVKFMVLRDFCFEKNGEVLKKKREKRKRENKGEKGEKREISLNFKSKYTQPIN